MPEPIADALVLVFTNGVSLRAWQDSGMLDREWALYWELLPYYGKLVLVTYGSQDERAILATLLRRARDQSKVGLVCNDKALPQGRYIATVPTRVQTELSGCKSVVIKTNQMNGGEVAVQLAEALNRQGMKAALVARGGYLWTRFVAHEQGPHSKAAVEAAASERALCLAADAVVGTTHDMVQDLAWRYGLDPTRTSVIPNYVLTDGDPVPACDREKGLLLYAGQLIPRKRVHILIEAMGLLAPQAAKTGLRLEVIGDGTERAALEALAAKLGAPVTFTSRIAHAQLLEKMRRCAIYMQASELEGHPKTVLEAMAAGCVVVGADAPGMEVIRHGLNGLRLAPDPRQFAHAISELLEDEDWRHTLGIEAATTTRAALALPLVLDLELDVHRRAVKQAANRVLGSRAVA